MLQLCIKGNFCRIVYQPEPEPVRILDPLDLLLPAGDLLPDLLLDLLLLEPAGDLDRLRLGDLDLLLADSAGDPDLERLLTDLVEPAGDPDRLLADPAGEPDRCDPTGEPDLDLADPAGEPD